MNLAIITCGMLPIPAVQGGAVENLIDFYLEYNNREKLHDITVFSPWDKRVKNNPALSSDMNHYIYIDVNSLKARIERRVYKYFHSNEYFNYFIEYYFEKVFSKLSKNKYDYIILENSPGHALKLSRRGYKNLILHLNNELRDSRSQYHKEIINSFSLILTCSNYIKERVFAIQPCRNIQTLYNAIDTKKFLLHDMLQIKRNKIGLNNDDFVIAYSGRINKDKGVSELIDSILMINNPQIKLMIIGGTFYGNTNNEDEFVRTLKDKARTIEDKIVFTGFVSYDKIPSYLHLADIAVLPSMWEEPFGLTIIEAMAAGLPLITTRSGGVPEICETVATIVDRKNIVNNLTTAILDLYYNAEKRKDMAAAALERAKLFDKEYYSKKFFTLINELKSNSYNT